MSDGYEVVMSEVLDASQVFSQESQTLTDLSLPGGARNTSSACVPGTLPDGGDATLDQAMAEVLQAAGMTTGQLAAVIGVHAKNLEACYDTYHETEESNTQLFNRLLGVMGGGS
jgi:hypothetical protein